MKKIILLCLVCMFFLLGCSDEFTKSLPDKNIELEKYLGVWYEIARLPAWFEKDLVGVTATYSMKKDGNIEVLNQGHLNTLEGQKKVAVGNAWVPDKNKPGRLKVSFFGPFAADYIVLEIADDYSYALVGSGKDYLWVLSRKPVLAEELYDGLILYAQTLGFDISKLEKVTQIIN